MKKLSVLLVISVMLVSMMVVGLNANSIAINEVPEPKTIIFHV